MLPNKKRSTFSRQSGNYRDYDAPHGSHWNDERDAYRNNRYYGNDRGGRNYRNGYKNRGHGDRQYRGQSGHGNQSRAPPTYYNSNSDENQRDVLNCNSSENVDRENHGRSQSASNYDDIGHDFVISNNSRGNNGLQEDKKVSKKKNADNAYHQRVNVTGDVLDKYQILQNKETRKQHIQTVQQKFNERRQNCAVELFSVEELYIEDAKYEKDYGNSLDDNEEMKCENEKQVLDFHFIKEWKDAGFDDKLLQNIMKCKYLRPNKVQRCVVPAVLTTYSVRVCARTGSGKTAAYMLPLIHACSLMKSESREFEKGHPYALVIGNTRELVMQSCEMGKKYADGTGVGVCLAVGGCRWDLNKAELMNNECNILCCTPGRLYDFIKKEVVSLKNVETIVFDEADELFRGGVMTELLNMLKDSGKMYQILCFSATYIDDENLKRIDGFNLKNSGSNYLVFTETLQNVPTVNAEHTFELVEDEEKFDKLLKFLKEKANAEKNEIPSVLIFCNERETVEFLAMGYSEEGIDILPITSFNSMQRRLNVVKEFRTGNVKFLVSTEILCRGMDFKHLDYIVNFDMPFEPVAFIHRAGRCGRIRRGHTISYVTESQADIHTALELRKMYENNKNCQMPKTLEDVLNEYDRRHPLP